MLTFTLKNKTCEVTGDHLELKSLNNVLSFFDEKATHTKEYKSGVWDGYRYLYNSEDQNFLVGLWKFAKAKLEEQQIEITIKDDRIFPVINVDKVDPNILGEDKPLFDYQINSCNKMIKAKTGIVQIGTGGGKTNIGCAYLKTLNLKSLFLVNSRKLLQQTIRRFKEYGLEDVGIIGENEFSPGLHTVGMVQTLNSRIFDPAVRDFLSSVQVLILDECHHASAKTWQKVAMFVDAPIRFGLSGTPFQTRELSSYEDYLLMGICGEPCVIIPSKFLVDLGFLSKPTIYMLPVSDQDNSLKRLSDWQTVERLGIVKSTPRNNLAIKSIELFSKKFLRIVVMVKIIDHGKQLLKDLTDKGFKSCFLCGNDVVYSCLSGEIVQEVDEIVDDESKTIRSFIDKEIDVLIVSTILDEGIDIPEIEALVILSGGKSLKKTVQRLGRILRRKDGNNIVPVVDFIDKHHGFLARHSKFRQNQYELEGHSVYNLQDFIRDWR